VVVGIIDVYHSTFSLPLFLFSPLFLGATICTFENLLDLWTPSEHGVFWVNSFIGHIQKFEVPPRQGTVAFHMGTVACPTFDWVHKVLEDMHTDMA
jgi:hypothetical protein